LTLIEQRSYRVDALAERLGARLHGDGGVVVSGLSALADATPSDLSLYVDPRYRRELEATRAGALLVREPLSEARVPQLVAPDPFLALVQLVELFHPKAAPAPGVHPLAHVSASAHLGEGISVAPFAYVGERVEIGRGTILHPGVYVGDDAAIGEDCLLWTNAVIREGSRVGNRVLIHAGAVLGADGFGFARRDGRFVKIRHVGIVVIEDDVEIGANATIDRGTLGTTTVRRGVKIDNLVHIAHNVEIGEDSAMAAQVGISGSTIVGRRVLMGGQVGVVDHLEIGDDAVLIAQSGVIGSVAPGAMLSGYPARPHREVLKRTAELHGLERLKKKLRALEREIDALKRDRGGS
jgi:UDP-3-O-[3-hydroxymyristoyl] glucosamine N-acyltransferase